MLACVVKCERAESRKPLMPKKTTPDDESRAPAPDTRALEGQLIAPDDRRPRRRKRRAAPLPPARRGCWGTCALFGGLSLLVITLVVACMALVMTVQIASFLRDPLDNFLAIFGFESDSTPVVVDNRTIVLGIRDMALLQTTTGDIQITKTVVDTGPAPDAELKVSYIGHVTAGIDLAQVTEQSLVFAPDGSLTVFLPPAQLTGCYLGKPDVLSRQCTDIPLAQDCGKIIQRLHDEAYDRAIDELRDTAYELDLLTLSYQEAEARVYDLLRSLGYEQVTFELSGEELPPSDTCFPD